MLRGGVLLLGYLLLAACGRGTVGEGVASVMDESGLVGPTSEPWTDTEPPTAGATSSSDTNSPKLDIEPGGDDEDWFPEDDLPSWDTSPAQCEDVDGIYDGSLTLNSDEQALELVGVREVIGNIEIGPGVTTLESLECLQSVAGGFSVVNSDLAALNELLDLRSVNGEFGVALADAMTFIEFPRLQHVGRFYLLDAPLVAEAHFPQLESIEEDARIDNLPMLPTCDAQAIFADLIEIGGPVVITGTLPDACGP